MKKQQLYTLKIWGLTSLLLLTYLLFTGKSCKTVRQLQVTPEPREDVRQPASGIDTPVVASPTGATKDSLAMIPPSQPDTVAQRPAVSQVSQPRFYDTIPLTPLTAGDSIPPLSRIQLPEIEAGTEILELTLSPDPGLVVNTGDTIVSDISEPEKVVDKTGSNYFTSETQSQINDQMRAAFTFKLLYDSITINSNKDFSYNTLNLINTTAEPIALQVMIASPAGWQMVTSNLVNVVLEPYASSIIPMRFTPSATNTAFWQQVRIEFRVNNVIDTRKAAFKMRVQEFSGFRASLPNANLVLNSYQKELRIPVHIRNSGNVTGVYRINVSNPLLKLAESLEIQVPSGEDTVIHLQGRLSEAQYAMLRKEEVRISVTNEKDETISMIQVISKIGSVLTEHSSAYLEMPLQLEVGTIMQGLESPIRYYGAMNGALQIDENQRFALSLRSNTFAKGQTNDNSIVRLDYQSSNLQISAGNVQGLGDFIVDGYGARAAYKWKDWNKAELFGTFKSRVGDTKIIGGALQLAPKDNLRFSNLTSLSIDSEALRDNAIVNLVSEYLFTYGRISLITGVGGEQNRGPLAEGTDKVIIGSSLGYNLLYETPKVNITSNVLYNSNSYPGIFRGQRLQMHQANVNLNRYTLGGYYEYNFRKQNLFLDTLLLSDVFNLRSTNYGIRTGVNFKGGNILLGAGNQRQQQEQGTELKSNFNYLNLNFSTLVAKKLYINLVSFAGVQSALNKEGSDKVFASTSQGTMQYKAVGATFRYDNGPYYYQEFASWLTKPAEYSRVMFSPFAQLNLWNNTLMGRIQANYAHSLPSEVSTTNVLTNINYMHPKGFDFNLTGIIPIGQEPTTTFISAAVRMRLAAPFVPIRKYYTIRFHLFMDENGNNIRDNGEEPVAGQTVSLNQDILVSDENGRIALRNMEKGSVKADFGYRSRLKGWIPSEGIIQHYTLSGNRTVEVPFKKSKILMGSLIVDKDELSNTDFNPSNIKVTATGPGGEIFTTITDQDGNFHLNLPAGEYVVSLNEAAFGEQFRPLQFAQTADLLNNESKTIYFEIKQRKRQINIRKK